MADESTHHAPALETSFKTQLKSPEGRKWILWGVAAAGVLAFVYYLRNRNQPVSATSQQLATGSATAAAQANQQQANATAYDNLLQGITSGFQALATGIHGENQQIASNLTGFETAQGAAFTNVGTQLGTGFSGISSGLLAAQHVITAQQTRGTQLLIDNVSQVSNKLSAINQNLTNQLNQANTNFNSGIKNVTDTENATQRSTYLTLGAQSVASCSLVGQGDSPDVSCISNKRGFDQQVWGLKVTPGDNAGILKQAQDHFKACYKQDGTFDLTCVGKQLANGG